MPHGHTRGQLFEIRGSEASAFEGIDPIPGSPHPRMENGVSEVGSRCIMECTRSISGAEPTAIRANA